MKKALEIFLGVMTALGGFVDIGELVFTAQAGAVFEYSLLWAIVVGTIGIIVYSEMCGRIAAVAKEPVFVTIRKRLGVRLGLVVWIASTLVNLTTCAAEIGGIALIVKLLAGGGGWWLPLVCAAVLAATIAILPFKWIERVFGFAGLTMIVFLVAAIAIGPRWSTAARDLLPNLPPLHGRDGLLYAYFAVGILSSLMMPYEVYFYSSGGIEDKWKKDDLPVNKLITGVGFTMGSIVSMAILVLGAEVFAPAGIRPDSVGSPALLVGTAYGRIGVVIGLCGMLTAVAGAAVETAMAGGYDFAQFFGFRWGRARPARETPAFDGAWIAMLVVAAIVMATGVDPIQIVELSVLFAVVCLPFTYLPILLAARDRGLMGDAANRRVTDVVGWIFFAIICVAALAAPVLLVATGMGRY